MRLLRLATTASIVLATTIMADRAIARDRPGTPNEVQVWEREQSLAERPRLQVSFRSTASEKVHFWFEWTRNGEPQSKAELKPQLSCPNPDTYALVCALNYLAFPGAGGERALSDSDQREAPYEILVKDVEFDTEYCFRFMAQGEDGVIADIWSAWACRRTRPAPARPEKPKVTQVTVLPARSGQGEIGGAVPPRVLVEWIGDRDTTDSYYVERLATSGWSLQRTGRLDADLEPLEAAVPVAADEVPTLERPARYRVCAWNVSGPTCSDGVSTETYAAEPKNDSDLIEQPPADAADTRVESDAMRAPPAADTRRDSPAMEQPPADAADTRVESDAMQAPPPDRIHSAPAGTPPPADAPPAAPAPAAEGRRKGPFGAN